LRPPRARHRAPNVQPAAPAALRFRCATPGPLVLPMKRTIACGRDHGGDYEGDKLRRRRLLTFAAAHTVAASRKLCYSRFWNGLRPFWGVRTPRLTALCDRDSHSSALWSGRQRRMFRAKA
jgi:hypothetical protein